MNLLFIADPLASFKTYKDTTYAMMREAAQRGHTLFHTLAAQLSVQNGSVVAQASQIQFLGAKDDHDHAWFQAAPAQSLALTQFNAIIMRSDPPFNMQYLYSTQLLTLAEQQGARVFNSGQAMRDYNEKLAILNYPQFISPTIVTTRASDVRQFLAKHGDIIVKPLDGMGGMGIFRLRESDPNIGSILETLMQLDSRTIMAQRYLPAIVHGDKRILIIDGEVIPYALARINHGDDAYLLSPNGIAPLAPGPCPHPTKRRNAWQPCRRRAWRGARIIRARPRNRPNPCPAAQSARHLVGRAGCHRRLPHRNQRNQPHRLPRNHEANRL